MSSARVKLYLSPEDACPYLQDRRASQAFVDPELQMNGAFYSALLLQGFRRSGPHVYKPWCGRCNACISARVPVATFSPRRIHRRLERLNDDLTVTATPAEFREEQFELYRRYLRARHPAGGMDPDDPGAYTTFLISPWCETRFYEFRLRGQLLAVAVVDVLDIGLSAVYTFFEPEAARRSPGIYALLYQIRAAHGLNLPHVYLGYWVPGSPKMDYKSGFQPLEIYRGDSWAELRKHSAH
jgi:arginine-tRNA-protein transferase